MSRESEKDRIVAIVGRPNVGKSSIFNRLAGRRIALVHQERGVTRDSVMCEIEWDNEQFDIIDTAGMDRFDPSGDRDPGETDIESGMLRQIESAIRDAAVIILVTDCQTGVIPQDNFVVDSLRACGLPVFVAANKADNERIEQQAVEFTVFGFPVYPVSALHNAGFGKLMDAVIRELPASERKETTDPVKVVIVGKPNVGKSSLINRVLRNERLIVSSKPGTTRDSVDIPFTTSTSPSARHYLLTDTAGIRRKRRIPNAVEHISMFRVQRSVTNCDIALLLIDAEQGPTANDKHIAAMIAERGKGCVLVVNKWDLKMDDTTQRAYGKALQEALPFLGHVPTLFVSAHTGFNVRKLIDTIDEVASRIELKIPTGILNRTIAGACERVQHPIVRGKRLKIYYATQTGTKPVQITLFVNDPSRLRSAYKAYIERTIRENFELQGAPLIIHTRKHSGKDDGSSRGRQRKKT